jgi:phosphonate transport system substrate-binding protein
MPGLNSRKILLYCLMLVLPLLTAGCDQAAVEAQAAGPDNPQQMLVLNVGLPPEQSLFTLKKHYQPLMDYLAQETGINFQLHIQRHNGDLLDNFNKHNLDAAFFGSFTGALAVRNLGAVPLVRPQFIGGGSSCNGLVFVRKDSGIRSVADLRNKRMVFVDRASTAGYLLPLDFFGKLGIANYSEWFKEYYFSGTHEDAILEVLNGYADIGAAKSSIFSRMASEDQRITRELVILATSPPVPSDSLSVRKDLPEELKRVLQETLLNMHLDSKGRAILKEFGAEKFLPTTDRDYQPVLNYAAEIGVDLATFNYRND